MNTPKRAWLCYQFERRYRYFQWRLVAIHLTIPQKTLSKLRRQANTKVRRATILLPVDALTLP